MNNYIIQKVLGRNLTILVFIIVLIVISLLKYFENILGYVLANGLLLYVCVPSLIFGVATWGYSQCQYINEKDELVEEYKFFKYISVKKIKISDIKNIIYIKPVAKNISDGHIHGRENVKFKMNDGSENDYFSLFDRKLLSSSLLKINERIKEEEIKKYY